LSQPVGSKPSPETWLKGRWRANVRAVEALALGQADVIQQALAFLTLQVMQMLIMMMVLIVLIFKALEKSIGRRKEELYGEFVLLMILLLIVRLTTIISPDKMTMVTILILPFRLLPDER
jgi:prepilin signal peptidase PulO-like enzyme (type II secretory pathway)